MAAKKRSANNMRSTHIRSGHLRQARKLKGLPALVAETALSREVVEQATLALEPALMDSVWVEYAYLSAWQRTELFTRAYEDAYRLKHAEHFDHAVAQKMKPIDAEYCRNSPSEMTALWHARQRADSLGVPYPLFIRTAMEVVIQRWTNKRVPRPNQLCRDGQLMEVMRKWAVEFETRSYVPTTDWDRRFMAQNFRNDPAQTACLSLIERDVFQGQATAKASARLKRYLFDLRLLTEEQARSRFGNDMTDEALALTDDLLVIGPVSDSRAYRPACLGLVDGQDGSGCSRCPFTSQCRTLEREVKKDMVARLGTTEPKRQKVRLDTAERVRQFRARKRCLQIGEATNAGADVTSPSAVAL